MGSEGFRGLRPILVVFPPAPEVVFNRHKGQQSTGRRRLGKPALCRSSLNQPMPLPLTAGDVSDRYHRFPVAGSQPERQRNLTERCEAACRDEAFLTKPS